MNKACLIDLRQALSQGWDIDTLTCRNHPMAYGTYRTGRNPIYQGRRARVAAAAVLEATSAASVAALIVALVAAVILDSAASAA